MSRAADLVFARLNREEGDRNDAYDDATGHAIVLPAGHFLTWGRGFNLSQIASPALFDLIERHLIELPEVELLKLDWYTHADPVRQSVFLDVAYNAGLRGLVHGFPNMIRYAAAKDWPNCAAECTVIKTNPKLDASRYDPLRALLRSGDTAL